MGGEAKIGKDYGGKCGIVKKCLENYFPCLHTKKVYSGRPFLVGNDFVRTRFLKFCKLVCSALSDRLYG